MKYQLFQQVPDEDFLKILLNCYGIEDIDFDEPEILDIVAGY